MGIKRCSLLAVAVAIAVVGLLACLLACATVAQQSRPASSIQPAGPTTTPTTTVYLPLTMRRSSVKWALWTGPTQLRGANVYQRRVYPELDGPDFMGPGPLGPPYTQQDFDDLAALGANYVNISHPGLFTEEPPYTLDQDAQDNLDRLLNMAEQAGLFAVITFRTGPGRSEFWAFWGEDTVSDPDDGWFDPGYYNNRVWVDQAAQDGWVEMPDINILIEMVNMMTAARAFEANTSALEAAKNIFSASLDI